MRKKIVIAGLVIAFLMVFTMKQFINISQKRINSYYEETKSQFSPHESLEKMEGYLKSHRRGYMIKEIIRDTASLNVKFWYGITISYSFLEEQFD